jgi:TPR repeat protein
MKKKLCALTLSLAMTVSCFSAPVFASQTEDVMEEYGITSEDVQFVANIFKQINEGNDPGLTDDDYYEIEMKLAELGADMGNGELALWVGEIYQGGHVEGLSESESIEKAIEWWERAVELGQPRGWTNIGLLYAHRTVPGGGSNFGDIELDSDTAIEYLTKADEAGDTKAPRYLGFTYEEVEDYENALACYLKAAGLGDTTAKYYAGKYYYEGLGTEVDYDAALEYLTDAGSSQKNVPGVSSAQYLLGVMYENGDGVDADLDTAKEWYQAAADFGSEEATAALERLAE